MRRKDREITGRENIEPILRACKTCRMAMIADGAPYVVPLNFGYTWDADPRVCFELDTEQGVTGEGDIACRYSFAFSSIVGYGSMEFAKTPDEKRKGFDIIMQHQTGRSGFTYNDASLSVAEVFHVRADSFEASRKALRPRKPE